jgi:hypothetical protein
MADADNFSRCQQAIQDVLFPTAVQCVQEVLQDWHTQKKQTLSSCLAPNVGPNQCLTKGKPKPSKSCRHCMSWGKALETAQYPPSSNSIVWSNINPTLLYHNPIEIAKGFVLRLPVGQTMPTFGDFDTASLLMIMTRFAEFHQSDQVSYNQIKKVFIVLFYLIPIDTFASGTARYKMSNSSLVTNLEPLCSGSRFSFLF